MTRPTVEVADIFRAQGNNFIDQHYVGDPQAQGDSGHDALPHRSARWSCRCLSAMWRRSGHLLQQLS